MGVSKISQEDYEMQQDIKDNSVIELARCEFPESEMGWSGYKSIEIIIDDYHWIPLFFVLEEIGQDKFSIHKATTLEDAVSFYSKLC